MTRENDTITEGEQGTTVDGREPLLDIAEVSVWLATSTRHVRRLVTENRIPYVKVGHFIRFDRRDIEGWIAGQKVVVEPDVPVIRSSPVRHRPGRVGGDKSIAPRASGRQASSPSPVTPPWLAARSR